MVSNNQLPMTSAIVTNCKYILTVLKLNSNANIIRNKKVELYRDGMENDCQGWPKCTRS